MANVIGVQANLDLIGLLSVDDANTLKEFFEAAVLKKGKMNTIQ